MPIPFHIRVFLYFQGTVLRVQKMFPFGLTYINDAIPYLFPTQNTIFVTATVQEILFDGILINCTHKSGPGRMVCDGMKGRIPKTIRQVPNSSNYVFSYFYHVSTIIHVCKLNKMHTVH